MRIEDLRSTGVSFDALENKFGVSKSVLHRHWNQHVAPDRKLAFLLGKGTIQQLRERAAEEGLTLLESLGVVRSVLMSQLVAQGEAGSPVALATVSGRLLDVLKEIGRLTGEIQRHDQVTNVSVNVGIVNAPGFADLQAGLLQIARDHPTARADIVALMRSLDGGEPRQPAPRLINGTAQHV